MLYMVSSRSVTDGFSLSVIKSKLVYSSNLPLSLPAKDFWKSVNILQVVGNSLAPCFFDSRCICVEARVNKCEFDVYFAPPPRGGVRSIANSVTVYVCLFACPLAYPKNLMSKFWFVAFV